MARLQRLIDANTKPVAGTLQERYPQHVIGIGSYGPLEVQSFGTSDRLSIGKYCSFADMTTILLGADHRIDWVTTYPFTVLHPKGKHIPGHPAPSGDVTIGNDVWMGYDAKIVAGVTIGDGAVIAAGAVVTRDVRPYAIVAGVPARELRRRFDDATVEALLDIGWWDWSDERIAQSLPLLLSAELDEFIARTQAGAGSDEPPPDPA